MKRSTYSFALLGRWLFCAALTVCVSMLGARLCAAPLVRLGYVIPSNRTAQSDAVSNLEQYLPTVQSWYAEQMDRYGFGAKTFRYETLADGVTPFVHVVTTTQTDADLRGDLWGRTISGATAAGLPIWTPQQVWMLVSEAHLEQPSGDVIGGTALGASFGSGDDAGVAMLGGDALFRLRPSMLADNRTYAGQVVPQIGPYPLVQATSFPGFEGTTFSSISSSSQGAFAHELGHALGLGHDFRNDSNFHGALMGNGLRGWRASFHPQSFTNDDVQLSYAAALALNTSRYFNPDRVYTDNTKPTLAIQTTGAVNPVAGLLQIQFNANDPAGLASAILRRNGDVIGEMPLSGTSASKTFETPFYTPGQNDEFTIAVYDSQGNQRSTSVNITPNSGFNRAPVPKIALFPSTIMPGGTIRFDGSGVTDADHSASLVTVEWDLNGDGTFDTAPSTQKTLLMQFNDVQTQLVRARFTDPAGAQSVSAPLSLRVIPEPTTLALSLAAVLLACARPAARRWRRRR